MPIADLDDPLQIVYLGLLQEDDTARQPESWLASFFDEQTQRLDSGQLASKDVSAALDELVSHVRYTKVRSRSAVKDSWYLC